MEPKVRKLKLTINVRLDQTQDKELPEVVAYAFYATGQFLVAEPVPKGEQGHVKL